MSNEFGTVTHEGVEYQLTEQAYASNYGTDGGVRYYASAIDLEGIFYEVAWDTTEAWDLSNEREKLRADSYLKYPEEEERLAELEGMVLPDVSDESNACDWLSPVLVTLQ